MNNNTIKSVVAALKKASKAHAAQAKKLEKMLNKKQYLVCYTILQYYNNIKHCVIVWFASTEKKMEVEQKEEWSDIDTSKPESKEEDKVDFEVEKTSEDKEEKVEAVVEEKPVAETKTETTENKVDYNYILTHET